MSEGNGPRRRKLREDERLPRLRQLRLADVIEIVEPDRDDLPWVQRRCQLTRDRITDGEVPRVDAGPDEREQVEVEVETPIVAIHVDYKLRSVVHLNGRDAHRAILPRAVQSTE